MKVGEFLMKMIFFSGMSQKELAEKIHTSAPVLNDMIKGKRGINVKYAKLFEESSASQQLCGSHIRTTMN